MLISIPLFITYLPGGALPTQQITTTIQTFEFRAVRDLVGFIYTPVYRNNTTGISKIPRSTLITFRIDQPKNATVPNALTVTNDFSISQTINTLRFFLTEGGSGNFSFIPVPVQNFVIELQFEDPDFANYEQIDNYLTLFFDEII